MPLVTRHHPHGARAISARFDLDVPTLQHDATRIPNRLLDDVELDAPSGDEPHDLLREVPAVAVQASRDITDFPVGSARSNGHGQHGAKKPGRSGRDVLVETYLLPRTVRLIRKMTPRADKMNALAHDGTLALN